MFLSNGMYNTQGTKEADGLVEIMQTTHACYTCTCYHI